MALLILSGVYIGRPTLAPCPISLILVYRVLNVHACLFKHAPIIGHNINRVKYFWALFLESAHSPL